MPALPQGFEQELQSALSLLGFDLGTEALDIFADPGGALSVLESKAASLNAKAPILLKALPDLGQGSPGFAPPPADPFWLKALAGQCEVELAPLRVSPEKPLSKAISARCRAMEIQVHIYPCCDAAACKHTRAFAALGLLLEGAKEKVPERILVAEARASSREEAVQALLPFSNALGRLLGVSLLSPEPNAEPEQKPSPKVASRAWKASEIAQYTFRAEGPRLVLRDHNSRGPRNKASRLLAISGLLFVGAAALWFLFARSLMLGEKGMAVALFALSALVSLSFYAFFGVGRFASRYQAQSNPLVVLGNDRVVVAPWLSREGAVDLRPEGRLGAAIPMAEVEGATHAPRGDRHIVIFATDHGAIDAVPCASSHLAELYEGALVRALQELKHPRMHASAKQRARARSQ